MTENCPNVLQSSEEVTFDLVDRRFVPIFRRILPGLEATYRNVIFQLSPPQSTLKISSSDWNAFTAAKQLIENIRSITVEKSLHADYEDHVNEELGRVKVPKKHLLGKLRDVFIDCNNVGLAHGRGHFSWSGVRIVCDYFQMLGHNVVMIVPAYRKKLVASPDERSFVEQSEREGLLKCVASQPSDRRLPYDDGFLLKSCQALDGVLISNDRFQDFNNDASLRNIIQNRVVPYIFIHDRFITGAETLNKKKIDFERLFVRTSPYQEECDRMGAVPCPYGEKCNYGKKCKFMHEAPHESKGARVRRLNKTLGPKPKDERVFVPRCDSASKDNQSGCDNSRCSQFPNRAAKDVETRSAVNNTEPMLFKSAFMSQRNHSDFNRAGDYASKLKTSPEWSGQELGTCASTTVDVSPSSSNPIGHGTNQDAQFFLEYNSSVSDATYDLWKGPNFELSPSKRIDPNRVRLGAAQKTSTGAISLPQNSREHFSYFSDSGSSCDDNFIVSQSNSPTMNNVELAATSSFELEMSEDAAWESHKLNYLEKSPTVEAKSAFQPNTAFAETQHGVKRPHATPATHEQIPKHSENGVLNGTFGGANEESVIAKESNGVTREARDGCGGSIESRLEDYNSVMQVLHASKQAFVLAVMKRHPDFSRAEIVMHVLEFGGNGAELSDGSRCCADFVKEAQVFIPSCYKLVGGGAPSGDDGKLSQETSNLARAFFAAEEKFKECTGPTLWRQVVRMALFDNDPDHKKI